MVACPLEGLVRSVALQKSSVVGLYIVILLHAANETHRFNLPSQAPQLFHGRVFARSVDAPHLEARCRLAFSLAIKGGVSGQTIAGPFSGG